jgi:transcriptional regulator with XRE-family HTH domain
VSNDPRDVLGRAIRSRRLALGLSQEKLAEKAELHWTYIGGIERGERNVSLINIVRISSALEVTPSELLMGIRSSTGIRRK